MTSETPFCDTARAVMRRDRLDYMDLAHGCDRVRSHTWWKNLLEHGPWKGPGLTRVSPPDPQAIKGIALLFGTTEEQVAAMVATDWYGVRHNDLSARALRILPHLDALEEGDAIRVEDLAQRLREVADVRAEIDAAARGEVEMAVYESREQAYTDLGIQDP